LYIKAEDMNENNLVVLDGHMQIVHTMFTEDKGTIPLKNAFVIINVKFKNKNKKCEYFKYLIYYL
jgi:hypothetical protein